MSQLDLLAWETSARQRCIIFWTRSLTSTLDGCPRDRRKSVERMDRANDLVRREKGIGPFSFPYSNYLVGSL